FAQRLITIVSQQLMPPAQRGSSALLAQLNEETIAKLPQVPVSQFGSLRDVSSAWLAATAAALSVALASLMPWLDLPTLLWRQLRPLTGISAVTTTHLAIEPGNISLIEGQPVTIIARAHGLSDQE